MSKFNRPNISIQTGFQAISGLNFRKGIQSSGAEILGNLFDVYELQKDGKSVNKGKILPTTSLVKARMI
jgi:hypothetical protein